MPEPNAILATDCGSTTTKAILIERTDGHYRLVGRAEAPTTVEAPFDDVTIGVLNAVRELEDLTSRVLIANDRILAPRRPDGRGVDYFVSTSSAGGGLQMLVTGVVKSMTAESAQRAALGAGAIVIDVLAVDDGRADYRKIERIRQLRPDMILMSGGTEGGTITHLLDAAEVLRAAAPRPRLGMGFRLPVIYAGNTDAREKVAAVLAEQLDLRFVDNLRPSLDVERLGPAREAIHDLFLEHVMAQAPGYHHLMEWASAPIMPTPAAVGEMVQAAARAEGKNVLAVDIGGATTDVFSVFGDAFHRTVSANLGMSYSVFNVLAEAGEANILRWLPWQISVEELRNRLRNKMIRPTTIPETVRDLTIEQAVAREALRLAFLHHCALAVGLRGVRQERTMSDAFVQQATGQTLIDMMRLDLIIGSGGALSHAPQRSQAALMMIDSFQPEGVTALAVDSIFMMPQLGVLSRLHAAAAEEVFRRDCLIPLGTVVAPIGNLPKVGPALAYTLQGDAGTVSGVAHPGAIERFPLPPGAIAQLTLRPARGLNLGAGPGRDLEATIAGGVVGLIIDTRGRPLPFADDEASRLAHVAKWHQAMERGD